MRHQPRIERRIGAAPAVGKQRQQRRQQRAADHQPRGQPPCGAVAKRQRRQQQEGGADADRRRGIDDRHRIARRQQPPLGRQRQPQLHHRGEREAAAEPAQRRCPARRRHPDQGEHDDCGDHRRQALGADRQRRGAADAGADGQPRPVQGSKAAVDDQQRQDQLHRMVVHAPRDELRGDRRRQRRQDHARQEAGRSDQRHAHFGAEPEQCQQQQHRPHIGDGDVGACAGERLQQQMQHRDRQVDQP